MQQKKAPSIPRSGTTKTSAPAFQSHAMRNVFFPRSASKVAKAQDSKFQPRAETEAPQPPPEPKPTEPKTGVYSKLSIGIGSSRNIAKPHLSKRTSETPASRHQNCSMGSLTPILKLDAISSAQTRPSANTKELGSFNSGRSPSNKTLKAPNWDDYFKGDAKMNDFFIKSHFNQKPSRRQVESGTDLKSRTNKVSFRISEFSSNLSSQMLNDPSKMEFFLTPNAQPKRPKNNFQKSSFMKSVFSAKNKDSQPEASHRGAPPSGWGVQQEESRLLSGREHFALEQLFDNEALLFEILTAICQNRDIYRPFKHYWNKTAEFDFEELLVG